MNSEQQQQRIMGYFIEEAREHLQTIEQGVLNLQDVLNDSESVNELFRAAHSIKGGAAMLGVGSIQHVAHRLEDFFKILTENPQIIVDERLKSLLLAGFDPLSELLDELQGGFRISDQLTTETNKRVQPVFAELESYLNQLVSNTGGKIIADQEHQETKNIFDDSELVVSPESVFQQEVTTRMRDMLQLFRGVDSIDTRSQLQTICNYFQEIGNNFDLGNWTNFVVQIKNAIAQPNNSYRTLAPILIRELKEAQDLVLSNRETEITVSSQLQNLLPYRVTEPEDDEVSTIFTTASGDKEEIAEDLEDLTTLDVITDIATPKNVEDEYLDINVGIDLFAEPANEEAFNLTDNFEDQLDWMEGEYKTTENQNVDGPKVGASELKSLAILFENDDIDFDSAWEDIESNETNISSYGADAIAGNQDEFADLLGHGSDNNAGAISSSPIYEESSIDQLFGEFSDDIDSLKEPNDQEISEQLPEQLLGEELGEFAEFNEFIDTPDTTGSLSSEEYFAELARQENTIAIDSDRNVSNENMSSEPFALTFSEEGMTLIEDPFAINENFNEDFEEILDEVCIDESLGAIDIFHEESIPSSPALDINDNASLNIFDELGFDSDEFISDSSSIPSSLTLDDSLNFFEPNPVGSSFGDFTDSDELNSEVDTIDGLGDFFDEPQEIDIINSEIINSELIISETASTDDLAEFFAVSEQSESLAEDFVAENPTDSTWNDLNIEALFTNADEDDLTILEENNFDFDDKRSLTQNGGLNETASIVDDLPDIDNIHINNIQAIDEHLTIIQEALNFDVEDIDVKDISEITASNTIDNLVDFFQVDDESDISRLTNSGELASEDFVSDDFVGDDFVIDNLAIESDLDFVEELNGIDDNFDFDDLETMIGSTTPHGITPHGMFDSQVTETFMINQQPLIDADEMNFDELEALLGDDDSSSFETSGSTNVGTSLVTPTSKAKPVDDFDDLEGMIRDTFGKDVGPIKTKSNARPPTTTRKQRLTDSTMRVDVKYLDSLNNLVGELVVNRNLLEQDQERLQQFITNLLQQVQLLSDVSQRMRDQYDRSLLEASLTAGRGRSSSFETSYSSDGANSNSSVTNDFEGIEMDRYNTFHVLSQEIIELIVRVRESASDIEFVVGETDQVTRQLGTITTQVQDDLKQSRMVPFAQIADRLPRGIRDRALKTGKQAELEIYGRETLIDKAILEQLTDPLTHLVNNAIDHGLEDPTTRQAAGKSATGRLTVRTYHQGNQTVISIGDDGAGISTDKVKKSAVAKRVRTQSEVDALNDTEVYALLFEPGFSTAAQADEFKGRGVGLDVVKTCLDDIRGVIIVESVVGKGTTFTIRLPLTLSISKAMFCISDRARVAFPVDGFEDMVEVPQSQIVLNEKGQPCLPWRDTILPFQHLSNLLSYSRYISRSNIYGKQDNDEICIIILRNDSGYLALQVDQFLGEYEIVIKQLEGPIPQPAGIAGATVLGDGRVMAIANVLELFDIANGRLRPSASGVIIQPPIEENIAVDPTVLIVDDSITVRELLSLTFAKVGYRVEQAKDGQDAWEKLRAGLPCDMIFCDIEMPRMDGLDLLSRLQKDARLKEIPVAMLTSRGADRHRQSAIQLGAKGYFTKPYLEEELLSASKRLLNGETLPI